MARSVKAKRGCLPLPLRISCVCSQPEPEAALNMGDKSPKAKDKAKKQDSAVKNQKKTDASNKANAVNTSSKKPK